ncbi:hypothetical protein [Marinobacter salicampi]|uniref:hypothetical protein n=1 Tax=Marinobacter salicampi TaxID=435907 RepID=UPI00140CE394|nr:hypothetical protein [Marinobacter salicampi]
MATQCNTHQMDLLSRLYGLKQKQLLQASKQIGSLQYRVLEAEAQAISNAMKARR